MPEDDENPPLPPLLMAKRHTTPGEGSIIIGLANIIEAYAAKDEDELGTRMTIMTGICAEMIWGLGGGYNPEIVVERHAHNLRIMLGKMHEHALAKAKIEDKNA